MPLKQVSVFLIAITSWCAFSDHRGLGSYSADQIWEVIRSKKITTIEPLLAELSGPDDLLTYNALSQDPTLFTDAEHPRVIATTDPKTRKSRSILAFTGAPGKPGWDRLQVLERNFGHTGHDFFKSGEFEFPAERGGSREPIWHRDPARCLGCHFDVRESSVHDSTGVMMIWDGRKIPGLLGDELPFPEALALGDWKSHRAISGFEAKERYRVLSHTTNDDASSTVKNIEQVVHYLQKSTERMGDLITQWNVQRYLSHLRSRPQFQQGAPTLLAALSDQGETSFRDFAWKELGYSPKSQTLRRLRRRIRSQVAQYHEEKLERWITFERELILADFHLSDGRTLVEYYSSLHAREEHSLLESKARLRWLMQKWGLDHIKFSTAFHPADLGINSGLDSYSRLAQLIEQSEHPLSPDCLSFLKQNQLEPRND